MIDLDKALSNGDDKMKEGAIRLGIRKILDEEFRNELRADLKEKHQIQPNQDSINKKAPSKNIRKRVVLRLLAIAGLALIGILFYLFIQDKLKTADTLSQQFAGQVTFKHPGLTKGSSSEVPDRILAIKAFNSGKWSEANELFINIEPSTEESNFYASLSYFYAAEYDRAIVLLESLRERDSAYREEINWYLGLSFTLIQKHKKAKEILQQINKNEWQYDKAQKLLNKIE